MEEKEDIDINTMFDSAPSSEEVAKKHATSKEKMDAVLGITGGQSVDDFLDDLKLDTDKIENTMSGIDEAVKSSIESIDQSMQQIKQNGTSSPSTLLQLSDMELSLKEVEELISLSKQMFKHIANNILSSDLIDSELVHAASVLMESIHVNIAEFIQLYKNKQAFVDKVRFAVLQQNQKKELLELKHKHDMEKIKASKTDDDNTIDGSSLVTYSQDEIVKLLDNNDKQ